MKRYAWVIKVKAEKLEEYKKLHAKAWPDVLAIISKCNIRNYSIYHYDQFLFSYFEYTGNNFADDMAKLTAEPIMQKWLDVCKPCQKPVETASTDEWWKQLSEIFHLD